MTHLIIIAILQLSFMSGCKGNGTLDKAESLMSDRPDSALVLLNEINPTQLSHSDNARYALLYSQALDKNYIDQTNDSLINIAVDYYCESNDSFRYFLALYYRGRVLYNSGNYTKAIIAFTQAEQLVDKFDNPHATGLLYDQLGLIFRNFYDYPKSLDAYKKAYEYYGKSQSSSHQIYSLKDIGHTLYTLKQYGEAEQLILEAKQWAETNDDSFLRDECIGLLFYIYEATDSPEKMVQLNRNGEFPSYPIERLKYLHFAYQHSAKGNNDLAQQSLDSAWQIASTCDDSIDLYYANYRISQHFEDYNSALNNHEALMAIQDSIMRLTIQQPLITAQRDYYEDVAERNAYKLKINRYSTAVIALITLLILTIAVFTLLHRIDKKKAEINEYISAVGNLRSELDRQKAETDNKAIQLNNLFGKQFDLLNRLADTYYVSAGTKRDKEAIFTAVKNEITKFANDGQSYAELEQIINEHHNNAIANIRSNYHLTEDDYRFIALDYAGFSTRAISVIMGTSVNAIYARRSRIKKVMEK